MLVSIIIPVYNRENLIRETLNSVLTQTFENWECIIVDDGSTDETLKVINSFKRKDSRFRDFERPVDLNKGANACRNFGFKKSSGEYIIWFDSDDLLTPYHIEKKVEALEEERLDFVVARTQNFERNKLHEPYVYDKKDYGIKASDFILLKIHWYTYDVMLRREIARKISWNEKMKSWQDYNYFCKMLLVSENGKYLDEILTYRRLHSRSIQKQLTKNPQTFNQELLENRLLTYKDISADIDTYTQKELIFGMMNICLDLSKFRIRSNYFKDVGQIVKDKLGRTSNYNFNAALVMGFIFNKGHYFLNKAKRR